MVATMPSRLPPSKQRGSTRTIQVAAYVLVTAALAFSLFCAIQSWSVVPGSEPLSGNKRLLLGATRNAAQQGVVGQLQQQQQQQQPCPSVVATPQITVAPKIVSAAASVQNPRAFHVLTTCQGFSNHWQARIHYYWYKRQRDLCHSMGVCDMGGFTRILHSGEADDLMDEVPTVVVDKLPESALKNSSYVVLNRPYAFLQWLKRVSIPEKYLVMAEADHLFMRPMPNLMNGEAPGAALFTYITPEKYGNIVRKFIGQVSDEEVKKVPQIGNSPTMLSVKDFRVVAPVWYNITMGIFDDEEAHSAWSWVLEMYGYALATYKTGQHVGMTQLPNFLAHPPFDKTELNYQDQPFYLLHLTYPLKYNSTGGMTDGEDFVWKFDKRVWMDTPPPRNLVPPPANVDNTLARLIISMFNEATNAIPCWDKYVTDKVVTTQC